ncbi:MAG: formamidopyrimidine-DNA glycosylase [Acidimicrobiaceae bacterium]|nr:formamidopyrimidine-DNA glycosylase [Acidimicrobiaceae bacterium]
MPELPDVEGFRRVLETYRVGQRVISVKIRDSGVVRDPSGAQFGRKLKGHVFESPQRRGKWLITPTDGPTLLLHYGMTGSLIWQESHEEFQRFDRVAIYVEKGRLIFRDQRKLGGLWLANDDEGIREIIGEQGPDALGLTGRDLTERLGLRRGALKSTLMDQSVLAGLGNMLSDEVLWQARIHPERRFGDLDLKERHQLDLCLQRVLRASIKLGAIPRRATWLSSQRSESEAFCPRCQRRLSTGHIGGRTSYWCPSCQAKS